MNKRIETQFSNVNMLVVEDYDFSMEIIVEMLRLMGIEPDTAVNGEEAVEKAKMHTYDLILMDILMPKMDGYEATKQIRNLNIDQPIITALSAGMQQSDKKKWLDAGMNDILIKPLTLIDLESYLKQKLFTKIVK